MPSLTYAGIEYHDHEGKWISMDGDVASLETSRELDAAKRSKLLQINAAILAAKNSGAPMRSMMTSAPDLDLAVTVKPDNRAPITHELKTWQSYFHALQDGTKRFEIRRDDRDFRVNDCLHLRETLYSDGSYTGRACRRRITYILRHEEDLGLKPGFAILSLEPM